MTATTSTARTAGVVNKGLRPRTLGLLSKVVIGVASAAPAYSLAAMLVVFAVVALVRVGLGTAPAGSLTPSLSWHSPLEIGSLGTLVTGALLMIFIYWGWDSTVLVNKETADSERTPGRAAVIATVLLVATYVVTTMAALSSEGVGTDGIGLANPDNFGDVLGAAVFSDTTIGKILVDLLLLVVLTSAAASSTTRCRRSASPSAATTASPGSRARGCSGTPTGTRSTC